VVAWQEAWSGGEAEDVSDRKADDARQGQQRRSSFPAAARLSNGRAEKNIKFVTRTPKTRPERGKYDTHD
jgi:hypothetical protein